MVMCHVSLLWLLLFGLCPVSVPDSIPIGMFRIECHDRHFWLSVSSNFLGHKFRFDVQADSEVHEVSGQWAAECGYIMALDSWGDLLLRVSYLACLVENQRETEFRLMVWFINQDSNEEEKSYPLLLTCPLQVPWAPRELVCEQNYMEVSVLKLLPPDNHIGTAWVTPAPVELGEGLKEWRVVFRIPALNQEGGMREETVPLKMAHLLGYHINTTSSRILLRCAYGSKMAYTLQWGETDVEVVSATILYKLKWTLLTVDMSVSCTIGQARIDDSDILWSLPRDLPTLVHPPFIEKGLKLGVGGRYLSECVAHQRGYMIHNNNRTLEIRIPFGAEGGIIKSHVIDGLYSQSYFVDVFLLREWEDTAWSLTQQRTFRALFIYHLPRPVTLINKTVPSQREFFISLCCFPHDVSLGNVTVAGQPVLWEEMERNGVRLSQNPFPNNTYMYLFQMPFSHPLIPQKYLGDRFRRYTLYGVFSFILFPDGEIYNHSATVEAELQDVVCLPEGRMVVMVDTAGVSPPVNPNHTALLDPACRPLETDNSRAIFSFSIDSCGTFATHDGDQVIYRNEVRNMPPFPPHLRPLSQPQPHYRVPLGCVHPENGNRTLAIYLPSHSPKLLPRKHTHKTALHSHSRHPEGSGEEQIRH
ncbi:uncharacterized protein LOC131540469 isoform X6 [Onychostoma macrolepis]|uniref:uncharacterized protein LOC131540469 isoform X6 n=1 Tax=Onychostoma macrolepis TaxID=369639 RepID=UPI00272C8B60|nr:uncharacterized protein LOC131540469 isoform X6 [Onychostoma macrolepis]